MIGPMLERQVLANRDAPCLTVGPSTLTRLDVWGAVRGAAQHLWHEYGLREGDRAVVQLSQNRLTTVIYELALAWLGVTSIPVGMHANLDELGDLDYQAVIEGHVLPQLNSGAPDPSVDPRVTATVLHTSGTSGTPKAVPLTWVNVLAVWDALAARRFALPSARYVMHLPLTHIAERFLGLWTAFAWGWHVRLRGVREPLADVVRAHCPHVLFAVPSQWERLADEPDLPPTIHAISASAPLASSTLDRLHDRGMPVTQAYGLTETCNLVAWSPYSDRPQGVGHPLSCGAARINRDGRIEVTGANLFDGYLNTDAQRTADGWFDTGDLGAIDHEGFLHVHGRADDVLVLSTGLKLNPAACEATLRAIPGVRHAFVFGAGGTRPIAVILPEPGLAHLAEVVGAANAVACNWSPIDEHRAVLHVDVHGEPWRVGHELTGVSKPNRSVLAKRYQDLL